MRLENFYFQVKIDGTVNVQPTCDDLMLCVADEKNDLFFTYAQRALLTAIITYISTTQPQDDWKLSTVIHHLSSKLYESYDSDQRLVKNNIKIFNACPLSIRDHIRLSTMIPLMYMQVNVNPEHTQIKIVEKGGNEDEV